MYRRNNFVCTVLHGLPIPLQRGPMKKTKAINAIKAQAKTKAEAKAKDKDNAKAKDKDNAKATAKVKDRSSKSSKEGASPAEMLMLIAKAEEKLAKAKEAGGMVFVANQEKGNRDKPNKYPLSTPLKAKIEAIAAEAQERAKA